MKPSWRACALS